MEDDLILKQPADRRLENVNALPPGPPGVEFDAADFDPQKTSKNVTKEIIHESSSKPSRRRSPSGSPPPSTKRKSPVSRGRRTPSPIARRRRSPSPRERGGRGRYREFSPNRRRYDPRLRRSPDRRRSPLRDRDRRTGRGGDRFRGGRSRTRSPISPRRGRWSPKKKPNSPPPQLNQPPPTAQYGVLAQPQNMYGDAYSAAAVAYNQYRGAPPPQSFVQPDFTMQPPPSFNPTYQAPQGWGVTDSYSQQNWMQQALPDPPLQMQQPQPTQLPPQQTVPSQQQQTIPSNVTAAVIAPKLSVIPDAAPGTVEPNSVHDAVAQEAENQRDELKKQRASYLKKTSVLKKELKMLKEQRKDLNSGDAPPSPTTKGFIDENEKLQGQIQKKLSTIENVIDMLTGIIGEDVPDKDTENISNSPKAIVEVAGVSSARKKKYTKSTKSTSTSDSSSDSSSSSSTSSSSSSSENEDDDSSPERLKHKAIESMRSKQKDNKNKMKEEKIEEKKFNYVFYDPEMHWCRICDVFPKTAKDYLNHLHTKEHLERDRVETPWHAIMVHNQYPTYENAPTKRTPIRGLTFFVPATAWYCKLCNAWMGDLHCASSHLKSQDHSKSYNSYLEKNPHFEVDWLADRQRTLNTKRAAPPPQQITSVSTTASEHISKKLKKEEEKSKKRKKKSSDKKDKKKKKRSKKRKKAAVSSSSSSSSESTSESEETKINPIVQNLNNPDPASSIRVAMRKQISKTDLEIPPPPPPMKMIEAQPVSGPIGKWTVTQEGTKTSPTEDENKRDDAIISQWNTVQPVISESEKKLLEQLKGKLKNKPREEPPSQSLTAASGRSAAELSEKERILSRKDERDRGAESAEHKRRRSRSRSPRHGRSRSRGHGFGGGFRGRGGRRSRSRSRGRYSPTGWRDGGRRRRSRSRSLRRRSRSYDRRRHGGSRSSRSRSPSTNRIEKAVVRHSEFRPRVPEKEKEKKQNDTKEKKDNAKKSAAKPKSILESGKKLPFIGKMPVFKKQTAGEQKEGNENYDDVNNMHMAMSHAAGVRPAAPTAAQIQMAMMEDVYGNAPPFHPDAGMMVDYDDLMPDPVQFVNIMGQAPPPPPPEADDEKEMLPPGIDETESEEFVPKPISDAPIPRKGPLPKDFEEALNIIFPGEKKSGEDGDSAHKAKKATGETQIIVDAPVMQPEDLVREGIHMVTIEETSIIGMDEASQLSMNEPLVFNNRSKTAHPPPQTEDNSSQNALDINFADIQPPPPPPESESKPEPEPVPVPVPEPKLLSPVEESQNVEILKIEEKEYKENDESSSPLETIEIPMPDFEEDATSAVVYDLDDIPQPPPSPTESEKNRRQEELDDLAMLGIDASDMAAQCM